MNMRFTIIFALLTVMSIPAFAQNNMGVGTTTPEPRAILDVASTEKGMLIPRMLTSQRLAIDVTTDPMDVRGLMVYDLDQKSMYVFDGTSWKQVSASVTKSVQEKEVITKGIAQLNDGEVYVPFDAAFKNSLNPQAEIIITVTPLGNTNGVYILSYDENGFTVKENNNGQSNVKFNWIAVSN